MHSQKTVVYHSGLGTPVLNWRPSGGQAFAEVPMRDSGPGRWPGERRWAAVLPADGSVDVFVTDAGSSIRDPRNRFYQVHMSTALLQDGQVFSYVPAEKVDPPRRDYRSDRVPGIRSSILGETRRFRVYLPRGYAQHTDRRYPVLYMHDGQNVFEPSSHGCWEAQRVLDRVVARGEVRELIVVAVDAGPERFRDYVPADDGGGADRYARFLIHELKPLIDRRYRTLTDFRNTGTLGSSLGAVASLYLGWDYFHVFGKIGSMSGSWWLKGFQTRVVRQRKRPIRVYLDSGDAGHCNDCSHHTLWLKDRLLAMGVDSFEPGADLLHILAPWHEHNETAWSARLPQALRFLFPAWEEQPPPELDLLRQAA
ncbi:MAG: alpha/beta hydrolase [Armatimonadetes bacterium]|nr:alpha/beta hydrolase [Armatimonadota bacterium]